MSDSAALVGGRYRLLRTIGKGGMGKVWHAHDEVLGRDVAVKEVLPPPDLSGPEREVFSVRTFREARAAGRVSHPGVATVYDVLEEDGHPWIVMQLVHSRTLGDLIRDDGPMPPREAAGIGLQILEALRAAHAAGVLHRDVKPDNVLLTPDGRAVLTDFGIATTEDDAPVTRTGILIGTPAFMAPERAEGGQARPASDLWSLGVTLYMAVEGRSPFQRDNALATLGAVMHAEPEPTVGAGVLAPVLDGLLRKDPDERMALEEAERRLATIVAGGVPEATGPVAAGALAGSAAGAAAGRPRRIPMAAIAAGTLVVAIVTGGAAWLTHRPADVSPDPVPAVVTTPSTSSPSPSAPSPAPSSDAPATTSPQATIRTYTPPPSAEPTRYAPQPSPTQPRERGTDRRGNDDDGENRRTREPEPTKSKKDKKEEEEEPSETPSESPDRVEGSSGGTGAANSRAGGANGAAVGRQAGRPKPPQDSSRTRSRAFCRSCG